MSVHLKTRSRVRAAASAARWAVGGEIMGESTLGESRLAG